MGNRYLEDVQELLTEQMIKGYFKNKSSSEDKYIITKQDLYNFSLKLIDFLISQSEVYNNENKE